MTREAHGQFAKEYLEELLKPLGQVDIGKDVKSEVREIDIWFVPNQSKLNDEDRELIMTLSPAYLKQREEWRQEGLQMGLETGLQTGLQTGRQEELRLIVGSLLTARFGNLDEQLLAVVTSIMELSLTERTDLFLNLSQLSREELLAKFPIN
jgi:flagellar biosynthesis/type III secretory pathway protein FliH